MNLLIVVGVVCGFLQTAHSQNADIQCIQGCFKNVEMMSGIGIYTQCKLLQFLNKCLTPCPPSELKTHTMSMNQEHAVEIDGCILTGTTSTVPPPTTTTAPTTLPWWMTPPSTTLPTESTTENIYKLLNLGPWGQTTPEPPAAPSSGDKCDLAGGQQVSAGFRRTMFEGGWIFQEECKHTPNGMKMMVVACKNDQGGWSANGESWVASVPTFKEKCVISEDGATRAIVNSACKTAANGTWVGPGETYIHEHGYFKMQCYMTPNRTFAERRVVACRGEDAFTWVANGTEWIDSTNAWYKRKCVLKSTGEATRSAAFCKTEQDTWVAPGETMITNDGNYKEQCSQKEYGLQIMRVACKTDKGGWAVNGDVWVSTDGMFKKECVLDLENYGGTVAVVACKDQSGAWAEVGTTYTNHNGDSLQCEEL